jgi:hypothetical protein
VNRSNQSLSVGTRTTDKWTKSTYRRTKPKANEPHVRALLSTGGAHAFKRSPSESTCKGHGAGGDHEDHELVRTNGKIVIHDIVTINRTNGGLVDRRRGRWRWCPHLINDGSWPVCSFVLTTFFFLFLFLLFTFFFSSRIMCALVHYVLRIRLQWQFFLSRRPREHQQ